MPSVTERAVICPVRQHGAHRGPGDIIHKKHYNNKDRQCQKSVCNYFINFIRYRQLAFLLVYIAGADDRGDILVSFIRDDAFAVVVKLSLRLFHDIFHIRQAFAGFGNLVVPFKKFNGVKPFLRLGHIQLRLNTGKIVFYANAEPVPDRLFCAGSGNHCLRRFLNARAFQGGDLNHQAAERLRKFFRIDLTSLFVYHIHHINGNHNGYTEFQQLRCKIEVSLQVCAVHNIQDCVRLFIQYVVSCHNLFQRIG